MHDDPPPAETIAETAAAVVELLDALQGRGLESLSGGPIPPSQLRALRAIERCEGVNLRALAERLGTGAPAASRLCDRMEADGLIQRSPSATSGREVELRLSVRGRRALAELRTARVRELHEILLTLPADSLADLSIHLVRLQAAIELRLSASDPGSRQENNAA